MHWVHGKNDLEYLAQRQPDDPYKLAYGALGLCVSRYFYISF
jgi:hypothetical protein